MESHVVLMVVFAFFVSLVFAVLTKDEQREQLRFGALMFSGFIGSAIAAGWVMYAFAP